MQRRNIQYQDLIAKLYPETSGLRYDENGKEVKILSRPITFCVTNACQLRCKYCYETHKGNSYMSFETAKKFIDLILSGEKGMDEYINTDISPAVVLEFIGGEPFLAIDLIDQIVDYWMDTTTELMHPWADRFILSICSNGVAYFEPKVQKFLEKHKDRLSFSVTIDGNKELHDSCRVYAGTDRGCYDEAVAAAKDWMDRGYYMGSKVTLAPGNINYMYSAIMHMVDMGYTEVLANCVYEEGWTYDHAKIFYEQGKKLSDEFLRRDLDFEEDFYCSLFEENYFHPKEENDLENWCGGNGVMIACDWDGQIYPCIRYMPMSLGDRREPMVLGNVDDGILQTNKCRACFELLRSVDRRTQSTDECFNCPIAEGCSWCTAYNYEVSGTPDWRATYICPMHKARALVNAYFWSRYYLKNNIKKKYTLHVPDDWALEVISQEELDMIKEYCDATQD